MQNSRLQFKIRNFIFFVFIFCLLVFTFSFVSAKPVGLSIMPAKINLSVERGKSAQSSITVTNPNDFPIEVNIEIENFVPGTMPGDIKFIPAIEEKGLVNWIDIDKNSFTLAKSEKKEVDFFVTVPENAIVGGHYAAIFFKASPKEAQTQGPLVISGRVGSLVMVTVPGEITRGGEILNFEAPAFVSRGPIDFNILIKNNGTVHFTPLGRIEIKNWLGRPIAAAAIEERMVFPGGTQILKASWPAGFLFGRYKATVSLSDEDDNLFTATIYFWALPWKHLFVSCFLLLVAYFGIRWLKKKYKIVKQ